MRRIALAGGILAVGLAIGLASPAFAYAPTTTITTNTSTTTPGGSLIVTGNGFVDNEGITLTLHSTPVTLGTTTASATGSFSTTVTIPSNTDPGTHQIVATGTTGDSASTTIIVAGAVVGTAATSPPLAFTGADIAAVSTVGAIALALGGLLLLANRRRRSEVH
jgi:5'-nucleotidase